MINYIKLKLYVIFIMSLLFSILLYIPLQDNIEFFTDKYSIYISVIMSIIIPSGIFSLATYVYLKVNFLYISKFLFIKIFILNSSILLFTIYIGMISLIIATFSTDKPNQTNEVVYAIFIIPNFILFCIILFVAIRPFVNHIDKSIRKIKDKGNIDNYTMKHDPLTNLQNNNMYLPKALGNQHELEPTDDKSIFQNAIEGHSIKTITHGSNLKDIK